MMNEGMYPHQKYSKAIGFNNHLEDQSKKNLKALKKEKVYRKAQKNLQKKALQNHLVEGLDFSCHTSIMGEIEAHKEAEMKDRRKKRKK